MKYIFITYMFDVTDVDTVLYKFGQTLHGLTYDKLGSLIFQDRGSIS
jgi:hypothetical protein